MNPAGTSLSASASTTDNSTKSLESSLAAKASMTFGSSFAVGKNASATSTPSTSDSSGGIPPLYLAIGAAVFGLFALLILRRKQK